MMVNRTLHVLSIVAVVFALGRTTVFGDVTRGTEDEFDPPLRGVFLGLNITDADAGVRIVSVRKGSAGDSAGLRKDDVIVHFADRSVRELRRRGFAELLRGLQPGTEIAVRVVRGDRAVELMIRGDPALVGGALRLAERVRKNRVFRLFDAARSDLDLNAVAASLPDIVRRSTSINKACEGLNEALGTLRVSHTAVIPPWTYEHVMADAHRDKPHYHLGAFLHRMTVGGAVRYFVRQLMPQGPARRAGIRRGDEIVSVNGTALPESQRFILAGYEAFNPIYTVAVKRNESVELACRRQAGAPARTVRAAIDVPLTVLGAIDASVRLINTPAGPIGYIHLWNLLPAKLPARCREKLAGELKNAVGLAVDLRGRGGQVEVLEKVARALIKDGRPVVVLIDSQARSAKDVLAHILKGKPGFTLVGERTAGAVRPGQLSELAGGIRVMLPLPPKHILALTGGKDLEGNGVPPDIAVKDSLPYAAGEDVILDHGVEHLTRVLLTELRLRAF